MSIYSKSDVIWFVILFDARNPHGTETTKRYTAFFLEDCEYVGSPVVVLEDKKSVHFFFFLVFFALLPDYIWKLKLICWYIEWVFDVSNWETRNKYKFNQRNYIIHSFHWYLFRNMHEKCNQRQTLNTYNISTSWFVVSLFRYIILNQSVNNTLCALLFFLFSLQKKNCVFFFFCSLFCYRLFVSSLWISIFGKNFLFLVVFSSVLRFNKICLFLVFCSLALYRIVWICFFFYSLVFRILFDDSTALWSSSSFVSCSRCRCRCRRRRCCSLSMRTYASLCA